MSSMEHSYLMDPLERESIIIDLWGAINQPDKISQSVRQLADSLHHFSCHG